MNETKNFKMPLTIVKNLMILNNKYLMMEGHAFFQKLKTKELNYQKVFLTAKLAQFGLLPSEWELKQINHQQFEIINIQDPSYVYLGKVSSQSKLHWELITLFSL